MNDDDDCMNCGMYFPGTGCQSQNMMACGCCPSVISPSDRIAQLVKIIKDVTNMLSHVKIEVAKQELRIDRFQELGYDLTKSAMDEDKDDEKK